MQTDVSEWTRNASYIALALVALINATGNLLLKIGAVSATVSTRAVLISFAALCCFALAVLPYAYALRNLPLYNAQMVVSGQYVLVILAAALILGEPISPTKWIGIALIAAGLFVAVK